MKKHLISLLVLFLLLSTSIAGISTQKEKVTTEKSSTISDGGLMNSSWPMCCHDTRHTGLSPYNTSDMPPVIKWKLNLGTGVVEGGIAIDHDGILYFGSWDWYVYAVYPNGTIKWRFKVGDFVDSTPAIASDGTIYVGCWNGYLYAINPNGTYKWGYNCGYLDFIVKSSPVIANDGTIYVGTVQPLCNQS